MAITQRIRPCLWFDNQAEEAARYYAGIFKNSSIDKISHYGKAGYEVHHKPAGSVLTVEFTLDGSKFTALNGGPDFKFNEAMSLEIYCDTQDEIDYYWEKLTSDGGQESMCGWLKDKYGLSWQVVPSILPELFRNDETGNKVLQAVMQMRKLDLATMKKAAEGRS